MRRHQRQQSHHREQKAVQHHGREDHLRQRNLPKEEPATPQRTSQRASPKTQRPMPLQHNHTSTLAHQKQKAEPEAPPSLTTHNWTTRRGSYPPAPSAAPSCTRKPPH